MKIAMVRPGRIHLIRLLIVFLLVEIVGASSAWKKMAARADEDLKNTVTTSKNSTDLESGWNDPPRSARLRAYWWWLNGNVTKEAVTRDLEEMKAKGFGGALICDAGGAEQRGNAQVPHGPTFFSPAWRELYKHALRQADRLGLEMSLNIQSGWNLGGPMIEPEQAPKKLVWSETLLRGPAKIESTLPEPKHKKELFGDLFVLACRENILDGDKKTPRPLKNLDQKAMQKALNFSAPDTTPLLEELPAEEGEEDAKAADVLDLTRFFNKETQQLAWDVPQGDWRVLRFGYTLNDHSTVSTCSEGWNGYALDPVDADAFKSYWDQIVEPLVADAGPLAGNTLKYLTTDSWEVEVVSWTPKLREEFLKRRGYDLLPYLPVLAGKIIESREVSNRFLHDFRKTIGDLTIDNHYRLFKENAHRHGLEIHPESGGPHAVPIDAQRCLGYDDVPMSEFWAWSWTHRVGEANRFFVKQPASAAHTYGHPLVAAEGFTTIGPHWQETLADNLKPSFDYAACEGLNLLFWHAFVCSPESQGIPGQQYFAGTHLNPNCTWWPMSAPFFAYINRCQYLLQRGRFVADACYYYGDHVPNFTQLKNSDPAHIRPGYDYDVVTEESIVRDMQLRDGRFVLPGGMSYRLLVLPDRPALSVPVLKKMQEMVAAGGTVLGPKPTAATGLENFPRSDQEVKKIAEELWADCDGNNMKEHRCGQGRIVWGQTARETLLKDAIPPDFVFQDSDEKTSLDYIHRRDGATEIFFVINPSKQATNVRCLFRVAKKQPELWNPVTGEIKNAAAWSQVDGRTVVPLEFAPCGSWFVVFRKPVAADAHGDAPSNTFEAKTVQKIAGPWKVEFDPKWGGPASAVFEELTDWSNSPDDRIRFYSGTATYRKDFQFTDVLQNNRRFFLDLGELHELARVRLNGVDLGVVWAKPFRVEITGAIKKGENRLEIEVVNFWPNRIIGDQSLPPEKRFTTTNIRAFKKDTPLMPSGLLGPVHISETKKSDP